MLGMHLLCESVNAYQHSALWAFQSKRGQIHLTNSANIFDNLEKYILQFGQIHLTNVQIYLAI